MPSHPCGSNVIDRRIRGRAEGRSPLNHEFDNQDSRICSNERHSELSATSAIARFGNGNSKVSSMVFATIEFYTAIGQASIQLPEQTAQIINSLQIGSLRLHAGESSRVLQARRTIRRSKTSHTLHLSIDPELIRPRSYTCRINQPRRYQHRSRHIWIETAHVFAHWHI